VPGRDLKGIHFAMEYLTQQNKRTAGISVSEEPITAKGKRVVIIGGGDTGSDCLGTAHRQGCSDAHQFEVLPEPPPSRASSTPWPLWPMQLRTSHAHEEGCNRQWSVSTTKFTGHNGHVTKLHANRVKFEGRQVRADAEHRLRIGCGPRACSPWGSPARSRNGFLDSLGVSYDARGCVTVGDNFMTNSRRHLCRRRYQARRLPHRLGHRRRPKDGGRGQPISAGRQVGENAAAEKVVSHPLHARRDAPSTKASLDPLMPSTFRSRTLHALSAGVLPSSTSVALSFRRIATSLPSR
jgi:hypothetical protein